MPNDTLTKDRTATDFLEISPDGVEVQLELPDDLPGITGALDLLGAELALEADVGERPLAPPRFSSDLGPGLPLKDLRWLQCEWDTPLPLCGVKVSPVNAATSKPSLAYGLGDTWTSILPGERPGLSGEALPFGKLYRFPPVLARRVLVDRLDTAIQAPELFVACQPRGVSLAIGQGTPFFEHPGPLPAGTAVPVQGLLPVLQQHLQGRLGGTFRIPLRIRAAVPGKARLRLGRTQSNKVIRSPRLAAAIPLLTGEAVALWSAQIGAAQILQVRARIRAELPAEEVFPVLAGGLTSFAGLYSSPEHQVAQGFAPLHGGKTLTGVDLHLRVLAGPFRALLSLHPDQGGQPAPGEYPSVEIRCDPGASRWIPCGLQPRLVEGPFWVVLRTITGEASWHTDGIIPTGALALPAFRHGSSDFRLSAVRQFARCRLRVAAAPPPLFLLVNRGTIMVEHSVNLGVDWESLTAQQRDKLNRQSADPIGFSARSVSGGIATAVDLEVVLGPGPAGVVP